MPTLVIVAVLVVAFAIFTSVWTDRLWYQSFSFGSVFSKMLVTRVGLFVAFGLIMATLVAANAAIAYRLRPRMGSQTPSSPLLERYRELLESRFPWIVVAVSVLVGLFAGGTASGQALEFLAWRNATPFGQADQQFGIDISFFVFGYPWWRFALSFAFAALGISAVAAAIVHYTMGGLRFSGPRRGASRAAQGHLSILIGLAVLLRGLGYWFDQYGLAISRTNRLFTGISYTADHATVNAKMILAIIAGICGLMFFANAVLQRWAVPVIGVVLLLLSAIVLGLVYPGAVQYFSVRPDEPDRERPYIQRNIEATRQAYGVDQVEITNYSAETTATAGQLKTDAEALPGIRLIDPNVVGPAYEQLQQVRGFYSFPKTLDVDRYTIDGQETDAVVAVREMDLSGVEGANWNNLKTVYTHGYGLVAAYGNRRQANGEPEWIVKDIPPVGPIAEHEPRIYFGELQGQRADQYSIVGAPPGAPADRAGHPGRRREQQPEGLHLQRHRRGRGRQPLAPGAVRREVRRREHPAVGPGERGVQDHLRPHAAGAGAGRGPVAQGGRGRLPGDRRGPRGVDRRRVHDVELLPQQRAGQPQQRHLRRPDQCRRHGGGAAAGTTSTTCATRSRPWSTRTTGRSSSSAGTKPIRC